MWASFNSVIYFIYSTRFDRTKEIMELPTWSENGEREIAKMNSVLLNCRKIPQS